MPGIKRGGRRLIIDSDSEDELPTHETYQIDDDGIIEILIMKINNKEKMQ